MQYIPIRHSNFFGGDWSESPTESWFYITMELLIVKILPSDFCFNGLKSILDYQTIWKIWYIYHKMIYEDFWGWLKNDKHGNCGLIVIFILGKRQRLLSEALDKVPPKSYVEAVGATLKWISDMESVLLTEKYMVCDIETMEEQLQQYRVSGISIFIFEGYMIFQNFFIFNTAK